MLSNFLMGSGVKLIANVINNWSANAAEERRTNALREKDAIEAHIRLAEIHNKDLTSKITRGIVFLMITGTFCYIGVWGIMNPEQSNDVLIPIEKGFFNLFGRTEFKAVETEGFPLMFQFWTGMEMILGAYIIPSRRR